MERSFRLLIENFDIISYLEDRGIEYRTSGKNVSKGWVEVNCLWCDDPSFHLGISPQGWMNCWRCGPKGSVVNLIKAVDRCGERGAYRILLQYQKPNVDFTLPQKSVHTFDGDGILPKEAKLPLPPLHREYLRKRGFDPDYIVRKYGIRACSVTGRYKLRIVIPVVVGGEVVNFTARDVTGKAHARYKSCPSDRAKVPLKCCVYNIDTVRCGGGVVVVEGPLDVWRIGDGAVATFGTNFTKEQVKVIAEREPEVVAVVFDAEEKALRKAEELATALSPFVKRVEVVELKEGDPCALTEKEVKKLRRWFLE